MKIFIELFVLIFYSKHFIKKKFWLQDLVTFQIWVSNPHSPETLETGDQGMASAHD